MVDKIFNSLSRTDLSVKEKLYGIETLLQYTLDNYTDDNGVIYLETYDIDLDRRAVRTMSIPELDNAVDEAAFSNDLIRDLLLLTNFAKMSWGASDASITHGDGFLIFEVKYGDEELKRIIDIEDSYYSGYQF